ncbi:MAG TPA: superoxide dismutase family protein [Gammaproteobacteria bacterium]|nr:superoxide dismutase family protein [Gammaproteobacteria bacterium]
MTRKLVYSILMAGLLAGLMTGGAAAAAENHAIAVIHPAADHDVHGVVHFTTEPDGGVHVSGTLHGLQPDSRHGFHVHQYGDCSAEGFSSAGGHYNPQNHPHGSPQSPEHHAGDFGNITADAQGDVHLDMTVHGVTIDGEHNPIIGRAVIVHENADDLKSQPSGDAGSRIGCGVVGLAEGGE